MKVVGLDAGGTLLKMAYEEKGSLRFKKYSMKESQSAFDWIKLVSTDAIFVLTGGKAGFLKNKYFAEAKILPEFEATCGGAVHLLKISGEMPKDPFLLVNIGTGTSWHLVAGEKHERVFGSGIGGGTLMGLGAILTTENEYSHLIDLAMKGDRNNVDLLVRDIYAMEKPPIDGDVTASNFGGATSTGCQTPADLMASLINMLAETIMLFSLQTGALHRTNLIYVVGSTLSGNTPLKSKLSLYGEMLGLQVRFIENGEYCGAIGAWLSHQ